MYVRLAVHLDISGVSLWPGSFFGLVDEWNKLSSYLLDSVTIDTF